MILRLLAPPVGGSRPGPGGARAILFAAVACGGLWIGGCAPVGVERPTPLPEPPPIPSLEEGVLPAPSAREAARLLEDARAHLAEGAYEEARSVAQGVVRHYPGAPGSGEALEIIARAALGLGLNQEAAEAAGQYAGLLGSSHTRFPSTVLLWGQALAEAGDPAAAAETLLLLPPDSPPTVAEPARELLRQSLGGMDTDAIMGAVRMVPSPHPLRGILLTELAVALHFDDDRAESMQWAREALLEPLDPRERELAGAILEGRLEEALGRPLILGVILPRSGVSPSLLEYGRFLEEGVRVAVQEFQGEMRRSVRLEIEDDEGSPVGGRASIRKLEELGAWGVIGPLTMEVLSQAIAGRERDTPIISPLMAPEADEIPGVFALSGPDMEGARALAMHADYTGLRRLAVLRPRTATARLESNAFREEVQVLGIATPREVVYEPDATSFREELTQVARARPDGLFLPLAPHEIELLAPQLTFYGLDTLDIQFLGTSGWAADQVLSRVDSRHTDGVVTSTAHMGPEDMEAFHRFRDAYESMFQKSLRSHVPAFGYDAAALLLKALQSRPRDTDELMRALEQIRDFPGATGRLSVEGGRIRRAPRLARIQAGELVPIQPHSH